METRRTRLARIVLLYAAFTEHADEDRFRTAIESSYQTASLARLVSNSGGSTQRAAVVALGVIGDSLAIPVLGPLLRHHDRSLRSKVDEALASICEQAGNEEQVRGLEQVAQLNEQGHFDQVVELSTQLIDGTNRTVELLHQRSLAFFQLDSIEHAVSDCREILKLQPYHYSAMVGLAQCHLELGDLLEAVFWYRQALDTYPDLEAVRIKVQKLEKALLDL